VSGAAPVPEDAAIAAFLRRHPDWLADNPEFYRLLAPPRRVHGEALADHMAAMLAAERAAAATALAARRAAASLMVRVQEAVLALMRAKDPLECLTGDWPGILAVDAVALCAEGTLPGARKLPAGTVAGLLGARDVVSREAPEDAVLLHGEAARLARHDALVRMPGAWPPALLALAARDRLLAAPGEASLVLAFLGRAAAAALLLYGG
jgi:hypothetical protein